MEIEKNEGENVSVSNSPTPQLILLRDARIPSYTGKRRGQTFQRFRRHLAAIQNAVHDGFRHLVLIQVRAIFAVQPGQRAAQASAHPAAQIQASKLPGFPLIECLGQRQR
jgi:hypothetical protein